MFQRWSKPQLRYWQQQVLRLVASVALALVMLGLVRLELTVLAVLLVAASKWQLFLGGPRLWLHNVRDNGVDLIFVASIIALLVLYNNEPSLQLGVIGLYLGWQMLIKPMTGVAGHGVQSLLAMAIAISVIFVFKTAIGVSSMIALSAVVALATADHALVSIVDDAKLRRLLSAVWMIITVQTTWLLGHWLVFYTFLQGRILVPQAAVVLTVLGYSFGAMYYDHYRRRLNRRRLFLYLGLVVLVVILLVVASDWISQL